MIPAENVHKVFDRDRFAVGNGIEIVEYDINYAKVKMTVQDRHRNGMEQVMGGALFTMADYAFAIASNLGHGATVTLDSSISFLSTTRSDCIFAVARCVKDGRRSCVFDVEITDAGGKRLAVCRTTGMRVSDDPIDPGLCEE